MPESSSLFPAPVTRCAAGGRILHPHPEAGASFRARSSPGPGWVGKPSLRGDDPCMDGRGASGSAQLSGLPSLLPFLLWDFSGDLAGVVRGVTFPLGTCPLRDRRTHGDASSSLTKCLGPGSLWYSSDTFTGQGCKKYRSKSPPFQPCPTQTCPVAPGGQHVSSGPARCWRGAARPALPLLHKVTLMFYSSPAIHYIA